MANFIGKNNVFDTATDYCILCIETLKHGHVLFYCQFYRDIPHHLITSLNSLGLNWELLAAV